MSQSVRFNIILPASLIAQLDLAAALEYASRSQYIRRLIVQELNNLRTDALRVPAATDNAQLEAAIAALIRERNRRIGRKELKEVRRQLRAGTLRVED